MLELVLVSYPHQLVLVQQIHLQFKLSVLEPLRLQLLNYLFKHKRLGGQERTQINELVVLNDSEEVYLLDYAQMINDNISGTNAPSVGLGTFGADVRSGITSVYFTPETGIGVTMRVHQTSIGSTATGIGSTTISLTEVLSTTTNIAATGSPQANKN